METTFDSKLYKTIIITVDGTAASGKGTIVDGLQEKLDERYKTLDAGLMYRALTWYFLKEKELQPYQLELERDLEGLLRRSLKIRFNEEGRIILNERVFSKEDELKELRTPELGQIVSKYSSLDDVKKYLVSEQTNIISNRDYGWILDGRCMGTAVASNAQVKIFVDAPLEIRAERRHRDFEKQGRNDKSVEVVYNDLKHRDNDDWNQNIAPLKIPSGIILYIDSKENSKERALDMSFDFVKKAIIQVGKF